MFKIISKKRYEALKKAPENLKELFDTHYNAEVERRTIAESEVERLREGLHIAEFREERVEQLTAELDKYKSLYADELNKRLDLAEKVAKIDEQSKADVQTSKTEAIKEFVERFENELGEDVFNHYPFVLAALDNLVKEMTEAQND